ncbi:MAG TPA: nitrilase-related carbon-nitrogen hydrolase [Nitrospiria bacterium]|jgi:N-carbamoylputrescine amidase|nr:nitrilase-related carbon-nitrogen hydrolase [Nitrospiria bacterium]
MLKIAGIQMRCSKDPDSNLRKAIEMIALAAERGAGIISTQQLFNLPWFAFESREDHFRWAEPIDGPTVSALRAEARKHAVVLIGTFFEKDGDAHYNTSAVIEKDGTLVGRYRKVHLPQIPLWEEKYYFKAGDLGFPVFETSLARIGIQICWDNFFPEGSRIMALQGAQILFAPTAAAFASQSRWEKMICANAIANNVFILRINRAGQEERQTFYGRSFCVNPFGELIASPAGENDAVVFSEVNLNEVQETRDIWTFFRDRRPELYGELAQP